MSDVPYGPPPAGWYMLGNNPNDLAYCDGRAWTWRRWRLPSGEWHQEPLLPPLTTVPEALSPPGGAPVGPSAGAPVGPSAGAPGWSGGPSGLGTPRHEQMPGYPTTPGGPWGSGYPTTPGGAWGTGYPAARGGPPPYGSPPSPPPGHLVLLLSEPQHQARWKTLLRGLLVLPNAVVLAFVGFAATFVTIVMWCAALFTARVPEGMWRFSKGVLEWGCRTAAYTFFLTDKYPPFDLGEVAYPVSFRLERPDRFNRLAVLFRVILTIPAAIVSTVFMWGVYVFSIVTWLATLVLGRCPRPLHLVLAAWLRYQLRYSAYYWLLTTEYPSSPLGDPQTSYGSLESGEIVLRGASKALAVTAIVVGALLYMSFTFLPTIFGPQVRAQSAMRQLSALESRSTAAQAKLRTRTGRCPPTTWHCVAGAMPIVERSLVTQISSIEAITFPTNRTRRDAKGVLALLDEERSAVTQLQDAATAGAFHQGLTHVISLTQRLQPLVLKLQDDLASTP